MGGSYDLSRTDQVGSLLRTPLLKQAWSRRDQQAISDEEFGAIQTEAVAQVIGAQQERAIVPITDGEYWRRGFQDTFADAVNGYAPLDAEGVGNSSRSESGTPGQISETTYVRRQRATDRLSLHENRLLIDYTNDLDITDTPVKVTLTGPERITQRFDLEHSGSIYESFDDFMTDVISIEHRMLEEVIAAGCPYVQIDEPAYTAYVDPASHEWMRERNWDRAAGLSRAIAADNAVIANFTDTTFGLHICRGNGGGAWHREGFYDEIAEEVFSELNFNRLLLEYDTERAGSFEPLRFIPKGKVAVLGLISTKTAALEDYDDVLRRLDEAAKFVAVDQMAISPQCGFASSIGGNPLSEDDQWRKLELVQRVAAAYWA